MSDPVSAAAKFAAATPMAGWLNFSVGANEGALFYKLGFREAHIGNPLARALHGGVVCAFLEVAMQAELYAAIGRPGSTVNISIDYLAGAKAQDMTASVNIDKLGQRLAFLEATAFQDDGARRVAVARGCLRLS